MRRMDHRSILLPLFLVLSACSVGVERGRSSNGTALEHPAALVGRWVRLREDHTWGDTLEYRADGEVAGSVGHLVPAGAYWGVKDDPAGTQLFCAGDPAGGGYCQTYRLEGDQMILGGGPYGPSTFRKLR